MAEKSFEKIIDQIGVMTVLELADLVKALEEKFGVSASMAMAAAPAAAEAAPAAVEKEEFKVTLTAGGENKIDVIKALRATLSLSLGDAKKAFEEAPMVLSEALPKVKAKELKDALEKVGAKVELA
jgi:large subunit ribosomal protein L7/L12